MSGSLLQIVAQGSQDALLMDQTSLFHTVYRKHAPFAIQTVECDVPAMDGVFGESMRITIPRKGDMLSKVYVQVSLKKQGTTYYPAQELLQETKLYIGSQTIDTITNDWMRIQIGRAHV